MSNPFDAFDPTADTDSDTAQTNTDSTTDHSAGYTAQTDTDSARYDSAGYDSAGYDSAGYTEPQQFDAEDYDRYASEGTYHYTREQGPHSDWNLPPMVWVSVGLSVLSLFVGLILIAVTS